MDSRTQTVNPRSLLSLRRFDIPVKWRYFRHLMNGDDPDAERVYLWHIGKRIDTNKSEGVGMDTAKSTPQGYIQGCRALLQSMVDKGYDADWPIPVDPDGELIGGAHRLACALALGVDVAVQRCKTEAWAPSWGFRWFVVNGMADADRHRMLQDWETLCLDDSPGEARPEAHEELQAVLGRDPANADRRAQAEAEG